MAGCLAEVIELGMNRIGKKKDNPKNYAPTAKDKRKPTKLHHLQSQTQIIKELVSFVLTHQSRVAPTFDPDR